MKQWQHQYWVYVAALFFGTWFIGSLLAKIVGLGVARYQRWRNPPNMTIEAHGGRKAIVQIHHDGESAIYAADARIVKTLDDAANPGTQWFKCDLYLNGHRCVQTAPLSKGQFANIEIAEIDVPDFPSGKSSLSVRRGSGLRDIRVLDCKGIVIEVRLRTKPVIATQPIRQFEVRWVKIIDMAIKELEIPLESITSPETMELA